MILYIAGKMNGLPDRGKPHFREAAQRLRKNGHIVLNPAVLPVGLYGTNYMPICMAMIDAAEAVYTLDNWEDSPGATIEVSYAKYQGKAILYEKDGTP